MACGRTTRISRLRRLLRCSKAVAVLALAILTVTPAALGAATPLKTAVTAGMSGGYARLVFSSSEYLDATARVTANVLIVTFKQPIDIAVDRIAEQVPDYIGAARRDPDGKAVRMALEQNVTVHIMAAGEKLFVDLLPATWKGLPPALPQDVIDELARRARAAEQLLARERHANRDKKIPVISVHVATEPTFTRYVFDAPNDTAVSANRDQDRLIVKFDEPATFDLGEAEATLPAAIEEISSELDQDSSLVRFIFAAKVDVRSFRDEQGFVVDIGKPAGKISGAKEPPANAAGQGTAEAKFAAAAAAVAAAAAAPGPPAAAKPPAVPPVAPAAPAAPAAAAKPPAAAAQSAPSPEVKPNPAPPPPAAAKNDAAAAAPIAAPAPAATPAAQTAAPVAPPTPPAAPRPPPAASAAAPAAAAAVPAPAAAAVATSPPPVPPAAAAPKPGDAVAAPAAGHKAANPNSIAVELGRDGANLKLSFAFAAPVAAAVFHRADTLWIVFDSKADIDLSGLDGEPSRTIRAYRFSQDGGADIVRLKLDRPHLSSVVADGPVWTVEIGDSALDPTRALDISRNLIGPNRSSVTITLDAPQQVHRLVDPEVGDTLDVVTALPPARGFIDEQDFIEFRALASTQGVVIEPLADDLEVKLAPDKIVVSRPSGLTLSTSLQSLLRGSGLRPVMFDSQIWGFDRQGSYFDRQSHLIAAAAAAPERKRLLPRLDLARFYLARGMYPEAKGVLDVALADERNTAESASALVLRAVAEVMMHRPEDALKDLADPSVGDQHDAPLWRALAYARQGRWSAAREAFKTVEAAVATLPVELQRVALKDEMRSAIEVGDFDGASTELNDFETIGVPHEMEPAIAVLMGRLAEGMGRTEDALAAYRTAADSWDRPAAAQGLLRETVLRYRLGDLKRDEVINQLESLTTIWRGDETEIEALKVLAHLYTEEGRYRDAFYVMRSAMAARPEFGLDPANPGRGGKDLQLAVPCRQRRRHAGDRCARAVLRLPRTHPCRQPRRRNDPPACRPAGFGGSVGSGRESPAVPGRSPPARRGPRAGGHPARGDLSDGPQA